MQAGNGSSIGEAEDTGEWANTQHGTGRHIGAAGSLLWVGIVPTALGTAQLSE